MRLTKYTHSCIRIEKDSEVLVIDPGTFSEVDEALDGAAYVLITHEHPDHFDSQKVMAFLTEHPEVEVYAPAGVAKGLRESVEALERIHEARGDSEFSLGGFSIKTFGGQHALIHPLVKTIDNVGYLIDDDLFHPGDSFVVPHGLRVKNLLVPIHAPWNKLQEVVDFVIAVGAEKAYPIHDALLGDNGKTMIETHVGNFGRKYGTTYQHLDTRESIEI